MQLHLQTNKDIQEIRCHLHRLRSDLDRNAPRWSILNAWTYWFWENYYGRSLHYGIWSCYDHYPCDARHDRNSWREISSHGKRSSPKQNLWSFHFILRYRWGPWPHTWLSVWGACRVQIITRHCCFGFTRIYDDILYLLRQKILAWENSRAKRQLKSPFGQ